MRISAKAEYACVAMLALAAQHQGPQPLRVKTIADAHAIPQRFLVQILLQLKRGGLVASVRGAAGGYQLARSPEAISLAEIIRAIDYEPAPAFALPVSSRSPFVQAIHAVWHDLEAEQQRILQELTLAELVRRTQPATPFTYQI